MRRYAFLFFFVALSAVAGAQKLKVSVAEAGTLSEKLVGNEQIESIVVTGRIDDSDLRALRRLPRLKKVDLRKVKNVVLGDSAFFGMSQLESCRLPKYLQKLGCSAFEGCVRLKYVECSGYMEELPERMFAGCKSLDRLDILNSRVTRIGRGAFMNSGIRLLPLPKMLASIGPMAFYGCEQIERVRIPMWVGQIGSLAFAGCTRLRDIVLMMDTPPACSMDAFQGVTSCTLYVRHPEFFRDRQPWSSINLSYDNYNGDELQSFDKSDITDLKKNLKK